EAEAIALRADAARGRNADVLEDHLACRLRIPAHLFLVGAERHALVGLAHDEGGDAFGPVGAGARHHDIDVAGSGAGDELLRAVEDVVAAILVGASLETRRVGARARLRKTVR